MAAFALVGVPDAKQDSSEVENKKEAGTLTSWQLLAENVLFDGGSEQTEELDDEEHGPASYDFQRTFSETAIPQPSRRPLDKLRSPSFYCLNPVNGLEDTTFVTPKQHHLLYKEYRVLEEIGSGAFGCVRKARRLADGKEVVVKEIKISQLSGKIKAATMDEVQVMASLNHPNIVKYLDCFMDSTYINIVMEYCSAGDLAQLVKSRNKQLLPEDEVMFLFVQICLGLQYTHAAGVLHRDLKCNNCMLTTAAGGASGANSSMSLYVGMPLLKLGDFGVAKVTGAEASVANTVVGTPQYLPPEMIDNKPYGRKSDVWALGCILYELCSLKKAFDSGSGIPGIFFKISQGSYDPLPDACSQDLKHLVAKLLVKDPAKRPSVQEILNIPFVRLHLCLYLEWARSVPDARPEMLLTSLGESWAKGVKPAAAAAAATAGKQQCPPASRSGSHSLAQHGPKHQGSSSRSLFQQAGSGAAGNGSITTSLKGAAEFGSASPRLVTTAGTCTAARSASGVDMSTPTRAAMPSALPSARNHLQISPATSLAASTATAAAGSAADTLATPLPSPTAAAAAAGCAHKDTLAPALTPPAPLTPSASSPATAPALAAETAAAGAQATGGGGGGEDIDVVPVSLDDLAKLSPISTRADRGLGPPDISSGGSGSSTAACLQGPQAAAHQQHVALPAHQDPVTAGPGKQRRPEQQQQQQQQQGCSASSGACAASKETGAHFTLSVTGSACLSQHSSISSRRTTCASSRRTTGNSQTGPPMRSLEEWLDGDMTLAQRLQLMAQQQQQPEGEQQQEQPLVGNQQEHNDSETGAHDFAILILPPESPPLDEPSVLSGTCHVFKQQQQQHQVLTGRQSCSMAASAAESRSPHHLSPCSSNKFNRHLSPCNSNAQVAAVMEQPLSRGMSTASNVTTASADVRRWANGLPADSPAAVAVQQYYASKDASTTPVTVASSSPRMPPQQQLAQVAEPHYQAPCKVEPSSAAEGRHSNSKLVPVIITVRNSSPAGAGKDSLDGFCNSLQALSGELGRLSSSGATATASAGSTEASVGSFACNTNEYVDPVAAEQQEMLRLFKTFKARLDGSKGRDQPLAGSHSGALQNRLSCSGSVNGLSCMSMQSAGGHAPATKWATYFI